MVRSAGWRPFGPLNRVLDLAERVLQKALPAEIDPAEFERHQAFRWESRWGKGELLPIEHPALFDLNDLIGLDPGLEKLDLNVRQLLAGLPFNDVLLYGERGTGKSSAVRGLLERYGREGLRVIEVDRHEVADLPRILDWIRVAPAQAYLIFCDDLTFSAKDPGFAELKAALQGGLTARPPRTAIIATSNRRQLVAESMRDNRGAGVDESGELHLGEALEEKLALADRFGLVIGFYAFDQATYLKAIDACLSRADLPALNEGQRREALRFSLERGSRSGRTAQQFCNALVGRSRLSDGG
ncbi:ATP-binding protein [Myxococcota bacterium]|nr:ATP-binding protein [Myxococcota bacterium]